MARMTKAELDKAIETLMEPQKTPQENYRPEEYPVSITLRFKTVEEKDAFMGQLSDGWGENYCGLEWDLSLRPTLPSGINDSFKYADTFLVDVWED